MSQVNVTINGRQFRMACEEGQEDRLLRLAQGLESRVGELRGKFGEIGDARLTLADAPDDLARQLLLHTEWLQLVRQDPRLPAEHLPEDAIIFDEALTSSPAAF